MSHKYEGVNLWVYIPNKGIAFFFLFAFSVLTTIHFWQCCLYRSFKLTGLFIVAGLLYVVGFALRINGAFRNYEESDLFIASVTLIYASPPLIALATYKILSRVLAYVPYVSPAPPRWTLLFLTVLTLAIEALSGAAAASLATSPSPFPPSPPSSRGAALLWAAIAAQLGALAGAGLLAAVARRRCVRARLAAARGVLSTVYVGLALLAVRAAYRVAEQTAPEAVARRAEWPFCTFDAAATLAALALWAARHPRRRALPPDARTYLSRDGLTEVTPQDDTAAWDPLRECRCARDKARGRIERGGDGRSGDEFVLFQV
ncbi:hypothetical protein GGS23DRAFT_618919 [Durotheca rogersii]|uniref:uncharacterized protein n=1 Tax=Durotheca rogersii TaxID=419775 RepID=UPI00221EA729|nr:uncharacterized protein GGS23DRAFT_618919 [Durotheca rogersii]KAI5855613.1 hypothetical protein GGS23DRAFT_618919 [Durotheca rogersii]